MTTLLAGRNSAHWRKPRKKERSEPRRGFSNGEKRSRGCERGRNTDEDTGGWEGGREGYITGGKAWGGVERGGEENVIEGNLVHEC